MLFRGNTGTALSNGIGGRTTKESLDQCTVSASQRDPQNYMKPTKLFYYHKQPPVASPFYLILKNSGCYCNSANQTSTRFEVCWLKGKVHFQLFLFCLLVRNIVKIPLHKLLLWNFFAGFPSFRILTREMSIFFKKKFVVETRICTPHNSLLSLC